MFNPNGEPIHVTVPGSGKDPRVAVSTPAGVEVHHVPELHPDDITIVDGIPVTSVSRTLVDLAEILPRDQLCEVFANARAKGMLDLDAVEASYARLEWRPSLEMLRGVMDEFAD